MELCDNNILNVMYSPRAMWTEDIMEQNGKLYVPPVPGVGFINDDFTQIPWNSEILQSFAELTHISHITFFYFAPVLNFDIDDITYEINIGSFKCEFGDKYQELCGCDDERSIDKDTCFKCETAHKLHCVTPHSHKTWYIWTKEGFKIQIKNYTIILIITSIFSISIF